MPSSVAASSSGDRGQVEDRFDPRREGGGGEQVAVHQPRRRGEATGGQPLLVADQQVDAMALGLQRLDQVAADEPRAAGDQYVHAVIL